MSTATNWRRRPRDLLGRLLAQIGAERLNVAGKVWKGPSKDSHIFCCLQLREETSGPPRFHNPCVASFLPTKYRQHPCKSGGRRQDALCL